MEASAADLSQLFSSWLVHGELFAVPGWILEEIWAGSCSPHVEQAGPIPCTEMHASRQLNARFAPGFPRLLLTSLVLWVCGGRGCKEHFSPVREECTEV